MMQELPKHAEFVVVGLGAAGAATLHYLIEAGRDAIGVDMHQVPHGLGSSHGETRLVRTVYSEGDAYEPLARRAIKLWKELEAPEPLFFGGGVVQCGDPCSEFLTDALAAAAKLPAERFPECSAATRAGLSLPDSWICRVDVEGGYVKCEDGLRALLENCPAYFGVTCLAIQPDDDGMQIVTSTGSIHASKIILCAGAWTSEILPDYLPDMRLFSIERQVLYWFADPNRRFTVESGFKPFVIGVDKSRIFYGFPTNQAGEIKIAFHDRGEAVACPARLDRTVHAGEISDIRATALCFLPGLGEFSHGAVCMYPKARQDHFVLGPVPELPRVIMGAGLGGHGFKFATAIGETLAAYATETPPPVDVAYLSVEKARNR